MRARRAERRSGSSLREGRGCPALAGAKRCAARRRRMRGTELVRFRAATAAIRAVSVLRCLERVVDTTCRRSPHRDRQQAKTGLHQVPRHLPASDPFDRRRTSAGAAMVTFSEEMLLLLLNDDGEFAPIQSERLSCALAGAVLMDLAFALRIDTDPEKLLANDPTPTGNPMLDRTLTRLAAHEPGFDTRTWIKRLSVEDATSIREQHDRKLLRVFRSRRCPTIDSKAEREVKRRISDVLTSDAIPDPRDVALIGLAAAYDLQPVPTGPPAEAHPEDRGQPGAGGPCELLSREASGPHDSRPKDSRAAAEIDGMIRAKGMRICDAFVSSSPLR